jgi:hypothetical protein
MVRGLRNGWPNGGGKGPFSLLQADSSRRQQLGDADQVIGGGREDEEPFHQRPPAMTGLAHHADGLHPAEGLLDALALDHADGVAGMARRARIDGRASFCVSVLEEALARFGRPEIFNTDQGSQFTSAAFTGTLAAAGIRISMDGRGRWMDNVFIERLRRSLKHEDIYLKGYADGREAKARIGSWIAFYNLRRPHQALGNRTPMAVWRGRHRRVRRPGCGYDACPADKLGQRWRVAHISTAPTTAGFDRIMDSGERNGRAPN